MRPETEEEKNLSFMEKWRHHVERKKKEGDTCLTAVCTIRNISTTLDTLCD